MTERVRANAGDPPAWLRRIGVSSWLVVGALLVAVALVAALAVGRTVSVPIAVVTVIAVAVTPMVDRIVSWRVPRAVAATLVLVAALAVMAATVLFVVATLVDEWPEIRPALEDGAATLDSHLDGSPADGELVERIVDTARGALAEASR